MEEWFNNFGDKLKKLPGEILGLPDPEDVYNKKRNAIARYKYATEWDKAIKNGFTEEELIKSGFKRPEMHIDVQQSGMGGGGGFGLPIIPIIPPSFHTAAVDAAEAKDLDKKTADLHEQVDSKVEESKITRTPNEISISLPSSDEVKVHEVDLPNRLPGNKLNIKRKVSQYTTFRSIMSGMGYTQAAIIAIWGARGGREWLERFGSINNADDLQRAKKQWAKDYKKPPYGTPLEQYPQVSDINDYNDKHDSPDDRHQDADVVENKHDNQNSNETNTDTIPYTDDTLLPNKQGGKIAISTAGGGDEHNPPGYNPTPTFEPEPNDDKKTKTDGKEPPKPPGSSNTFTKTPIDPDEKKKKRRLPYPFPPSGDPRNPDTDTDDEEEEKPKDLSIPPIGASEGNLRPYFNRGGQDILLLTEAQKLEEIKDWDLYDLPIPEQEDMDNPIFRHNMFQQACRFYGTNGKYRPKHLYKEKPRKYYNEPQRSKSMMPMFQNPNQRTGMNDPFDNRKFNRPTSAYRSQESTLHDCLDRMGSIYIDEAQVLAKPLPYSNRVSQIDMMMSMK